MTGDVGVTDDLEDRLDGFLEAGNGDDRFVEVFFEVIGNALGDVIGQPPFFVASVSRCFGQGSDQPITFEGHDLTVLKTDEGQIALEADHEALKSSGWADVLIARFS